MAVKTLKKVIARAMLENGTDSEGNVKLVSLSIGSIAKDSFDADKCLAIVTALRPCISKTVNSTETVETSTISAAS